MELIKIGGATVGRATFQPGWKWSESVQPHVKTASIEKPELDLVARLVVPPLAVPRGPNALIVCGPGWLST